MKNLYFAYGANTNLQSMAVLCPDSVVIGPAQLKNYRFCFRFHADIELDNNCSVDGVLWSVSDDDLSNLDIVEGYPDYYQRHQFKILYNDKASLAWVYFMKNKNKFEKPLVHYLQKCIRGYVENKLPLTQIELALNEYRGYYEI